MICTSNRCARMSAFVVFAVWRVYTASSSCPCNVLRGSSQRACRRLSQFVFWGPCNLIRGSPQRLSVNPAACFGITCRKAKGPGSVGRHQIWAVTWGVVEVLVFSECVALWAFALYSVSFGRWSVAIQLPQLPGLCRFPEARFGLS